MNKQVEKEKVKEKDGITQYILLGSPTVIREKKIGEKRSIATDIKFLMFKTDPGGETVNTSQLIEYFHPKTKATLIKEINKLKPGDTIEFLKSGEVRKVC